MRLRTLAFLCCSFFIGGISSQDTSLISMLPDDELPKKEFATATFKNTRIVNGQSIENVFARELEFRISHRFGTVNRGLYELFGLDQSSMKMNFDYGLTPRISIGVGRTTYEKTVDGFVKVKLLKQTLKKGMPITLSYVGGTSLSALKWQYPERQNFFTSRMNYFHQLLIARKFNENFSVQLSPGLVHRNLIKNSNIEKNDVFNLGLGLRYKLTKRISFNAEYFFLYPNSVQPGIRSSLSLGFDIETGGHVFQLHFTNSTAMIEKAFIAENTESWLKGGIHFGFNISRVFTLKN